MHICITLISWWRWASLQAASCCLHSQLEDVSQGVQSEPWKSRTWKPLKGILPMVHRRRKLCNYSHSMEATKFFCFSYGMPHMSRTDWNVARNSPLSDFIMKIHYVTMFVFCGARRQNSSEEIRGRISPNALCKVCVNIRAVHSNVQNLERSNCCQASLL